ncbi:hypothetical protein SCLCIDRAFT_22993 [Scleroderma citrinum Foug A]|uniref:Uncharacterized protein n=1 Tax=Scleroderma citrinum Foug A TaxID=1036808 RepID=A0A0C3DXB0_9AGAM|nr:hypothetical protein SCLCIDRAFT_22993 [Scleroderma citrinum Foug A]
MSSGNSTDSGNNGNGANKIAKFDEQSCRRRDKLMKRAAEQEAQKKAKEERKKAEEEAKRVAEEEARRLAEEDAKKKAEEDAQKRAEFQVRWKADSERKAREKAEAKAAAEAMRAQIAQKAGQGEKPKLKPKQCQAASQHTPNEEKMKVKCHFKVSTATMKRLASGEKHKESEMLVTMVATLPRGGKKHKRTRRAVADTASTKEIEEALGGFSVAGPSTWPDPVVQVLDQQLSEVIAAIDRNTRELARLGGKMDGFVWEMKRMADHSNWKGKGRARPEETEDEEEKSDDGEDKEEADDVSDADAEGEDVDE